LLAFSRKQILHPHVVDLNASLDEFAPMVRRLIGEDIQIDLVHGESLGRVMADRGQVQQVLMNLALNARDAMPSGGRLSIRTANELASTSDSDERGSTPRDYVVLEVMDTGSGMDEATVAQIFEPFFTTKGEGMGTGLGLATVYGIVKQSGASITVETAPGEGTKFRILFPTADLVDSVLPKKEDPEITDSGSETILLVEDELSVLALAQRILQMRGYKVLTASYGEAALGIASLPGQQIDLVVTDVVMPGMNGRTLGDAAQQHRPGLKILYMTGYSRNAIVHQGRLDPGVSLIQKPFSESALASRVHGILSARGN
jgi:CheY-like chemotaxis protein